MQRLGRRRCWLEQCIDEHWEQSDQGMKVWLCGSCRIEVQSGCIRHAAAVHQHTQRTSRSLLRLSRALPATQRHLNTHIIAVRSSLTQVTLPHSTHYILLPAVLPVPRRMRRAGRRAPP